MEFMEFGLAGLATIALLAIIGGIENWISRGDTSAAKPPVHLVADQPDAPSDKQA